MSQKVSRRTNTVVKAIDLYSIRNGLTVLATILAGSGFWLSASNPQFTSPYRDRQIYENGVLKSEVVIEPSKNGQLLGLGLLSASILSLIGAIKIGNPTNLDHPEITVQALSGNPSSNQIRTSQNLVTKFSDSSPAENLVTKSEASEKIDRLLEELVSLPWVLKIIKCPSVVIVGNTGSGKSRLAMVLALIQALVNNRKLVIIDPDANGDLERGTWIAGTVYGFYKDTISNQVSDVIEGIEFVKNPLNTGITAVFDELSKYRDYPELESYLEGVIASGSQEQRKKSGCSFYLLHGFEKGMISENLASGRFRRLLETSAVIHIPNESDIFGEPCKGEQILFKESNRSLEGKDANGQPNWVAYDLPKSLDPEIFAQVYGSLIDLMDLGLVINSNNSNFDRKKAEVKDVLTMQIESSLNTSSVKKPQKVDSNLDIVLYLVGYIDKSTKFNQNELIDFKRFYDSTRKQLENKGLLFGSNKLELFRKSLEQSELFEFSEDRKYFSYKGEKS